MPKKKEVSSAAKAQALDAPDTKEQLTPHFAMSGVITWLIVFAVLAVVFYFLKVADMVGSGVFAAAVAVPGLIISDKSLNKVERQRIWVIFILAFFVIFFWSAFEQAGASLTFFADEQTNRVVGIHTSMTIVYLVIAACAMLLYFGLKKLLAIPKELNMFFFYPIGLGLLGLIGYSLIKPEPYIMDEVPASWFQSINPLGIILLAPLFTWIWGGLAKRNLEPPSPFKMAIGLFLVMAGYALIAYKVDGLSATVKVSMIWLTGLYLLHTFGELCLSPIGLSMVAKLSPIRFSSLLMGTWFLANAVANKTAGSLSALYPPGFGEAKKAGEAGIDLMNILNNPASASGDQLTVLADLGIRTEWPRLLGMQITDLHQFFMIFLIYSGIASVILFVLARVLVKMMHGVK